MTGERRQTPEESSLNRPIKAPAQLLVEGRVPEMFFRELVKVSGLEGAIEVRTFGAIGKVNLQTYLELFCSKAAFKEEVRAMGIVRDAESNKAASAFQSVQSALLEAGHPVPSKMAAFEGSPLRVGVFILPDCDHEGMLETLCLQAATEDGGSRALLSCVDEFFACLSRQQRVPRNPTKARFAGYALGRDVIDPQLGTAARQGAIPWNAAAFEPLKRFLSNLTDATR
jgi:hypothetical protein